MPLTHVHVLAMPQAARAFEWKPDGTKMSLLRHAVEKKDRAVIEAIISATE